MQKSPPIVCLDNNDYSALSDSRRTEELDGIRGQLFEFAKSGKVIFAFAGTHLMEMAPLAPAVTDSAAARADLLSDLCGRNALISHDRIFEAELAQALGLGRVPVEVLTADATWFPEFDEMLLEPFTEADRIKEVRQVIREQAQSRAQRRAFERKHFKKGRPTRALHALFSKAALEPDLEETLRSYPMRREDAAVITQYAWGKASPKEAETAFLNSLRDPRWMMRWFAEHHDTMSPISRWIREPSEKHLTGIREAMATMQEIRQREETGVRIEGSPLTPSGWKATQDGVLLRLANRLVESKFPNHAPLADARLVAEHCPGLTTMVRCICSAAWDSFRIQSRPPQASDFADAFHAIYAPYVSIFRADSYMTPHVTKHVKGRQTRVVGKLKDLPRQIREVIGQGESEGDYRDA